MTASFSGYVGLVRVLIAANANVQLQDKVCHAVNCVFTVAVANSYTGWLDSIASDISRRPHWCSSCADWSTCTYQPALQGNGICVSSVLVALPSSFYTYLLLAMCTYSIPDVIVFIHCNMYEIVLRCWNLSWLKATVFLSIYRMAEQHSFKPAKMAVWLYFACCCKSMLMPAYAMRYVNLIWCNLCVLCCLFKTHVHVQYNYVKKLPINDQISELPVSVLFPFNVCSMCVWHPFNSRSFPISFLVHFVVRAFWCQIPGAHALCSCLLTSTEG